MKIKDRFMNEKNSYSTWSPLKCQTALNLPEEKLFSASCFLMAQSHQDQIKSFNKASNQAGISNIKL